MLTLATVCLRPFPLSTFQQGEDQIPHLMKSYLSDATRVAAGHSYPNLLSPNRDPTIDLSPIPDPTIDLRPRPDPTIDLSPNPSLTIDLSPNPEPTIDLPSR